jgi:hypothetical protein
VVIFKNNICRSVIFKIAVLFVAVSCFGKVHSQSDSLASFYLQLKLKPDSLNHSDLSWLLYRKASDFIVLNEDAIKKLYDGRLSTANFKDIFYCFAYTDYGKFSKPGFNEMLQYDYYMRLRDSLNEIPLFCQEAERSTAIERSRFVYKRSDILKLSKTMKYLRYLDIYKIKDKYYFQTYLNIDYYSYVFNFVYDVHQKLIYFKVDELIH